MRMIIKTIALAGAGALALSACSPAEDAPDVADETSVVISAAFYPLEYIAVEVGGDHAQVHTMTNPGVEPHDLELSPAAMRTLRNSDLIIYLEGFQPSVDAAVAELDVPTINVADHLELREYEEHDDGHDEDGHDDEALEDHGHDDLDPHFWLDPTLYAELAPVVADALATFDAPHAQDYHDNAASFEVSMAQMDREYSQALAQCERDVIITPHEAYGYMAAAYGFTQVGLSGVNPESEPSPARVREVREIAQRENVTTIFFETLVDSAVAEAFARDAGLETAVLDPIGGLIDETDDYPGIMTRNLDALVDALGCQ